MLGYTYLNPLAQFYGNWKKDQMKRWMGERDPPPLNWSDLIVRIMKEDRYGEEDIQARGDCFEAASG
jgi:hypothetical protein